MRLLLSTVTIPDNASDLFSTALYLPMTLNISPTVSAKLAVGFRMLVCIDDLVFLLEVANAPSAVFWAVNVLMLSNIWAAEAGIGISLRKDDSMLAPDM